MSGKFVAIHALCGKPVEENFDYVRSGPDGDDMKVQDGYYCHSCDVEIPPDPVNEGGPYLGRVVLVHIDDIVPPEPSRLKEIEVEKYARPDRITIRLRTPDIVVHEVVSDYLVGEVKGRIAGLMTRRALLELRGMIDRKIDEVEKEARK